MKLLIWNFKETCRLKLTTSPIFLFEDGKLLEIFSAIIQQYIFLLLSIRSATAAIAANCSTTSCYSYNYYENSCTQGVAPCRAFAAPWCANTDVILAAQASSKLA